MAGKAIMSMQHTHYSKAAAVALAQQLPITGLFALVYDGGDILRIWLTSLIPFWALFIMMKIRRPDAATSTDLFIIRWATVPLAVITYVVVSRIWWARGYML